MGLVMLIYNTPARYVFFHTSLSKQSNSCLHDLFLEEFQWSPTHTTAAEGDLCLTSVIRTEDLEEVIPQNLSSPLLLPSTESPVSLLVSSNSEFPSSTSTKSPLATTLLPSLPLPPAVLSHLGLSGLNLALISP